MGVIDPNQFIIARKRKKYRFALFNNSPLCFEFEQWHKRTVDCIELGAGNGMFIVEQAALNPSLQYLAVDVKGDRLQKGASEALKRGITNVLFLRARADQLSEIVSPGSLRELWLTFSDPFPKKGSSGRRLTHPHYLDLYQSVLGPGSSLYIKHDNDTFFQWSLENLVAGGWHVAEISYDLQASSLDSRYKITTAYEEKWQQQGLVTKFLRATIGP